MNIIDAFREFRIRLHFWTAVGSRNPEKKLRHFQKMTALIKQRSKKQIQKMEKIRGLV